MEGSREGGKLGMTGVEGERACHEAGTARRTRAARGR